MLVMVFRHDGVRCQLDDREAGVPTDDDARLDGLAPHVGRRDVRDVAKVRLGGGVGRVGRHVVSLAPLPFAG